MLDPEALGRVPGQGLTCPQCNAPLSLTDLFGLSASFAEEEDEDLGLDDLVSGPSRPSAPSAPSAPSEGGSSTALELMRQLKRRK